MTLGTNASLAEQIEYAPSEIDFDFILAELKELEEWRELMGNGEYSVDDVKERLSEQEVEIEEKDEKIEILECDATWRPRGRRVENFAEIADYMRSLENEDYSSAFIGKQGDDFCSIRERWLFTREEDEKRQMIRVIGEKS